MCGSLEGLCSCSIDTDLDGVADCSDAFPQDPFNVAPAGSGSASHQERRSKVSSASPSWDGLLYFSFKGMKDGGSEYSVAALRPSSLLLDAGTWGLPDFTAAFSPVVTFGASPGMSSHLSIFPEPSAGAQNPYRSGCATGSRPELDPNGECLTYRFGLVGAGPRSSPLPDGNNFALALTYGTVIVRNPQTPLAEIAWVGRDKPVADLLTVDPLGSSLDNELGHYEPSISFDGHLLVWHGFIDNLPGGQAGNPAMYSFNAQAGAVSGWSAPLSITRMYGAHGAGAGALEPIVDGVKFSQRYPIAQRPLLGDDGLPLGEFHPGPYPWLSFDGSEIFFPQVIVSPGGPTRSAMSVIGARTGWRLQHLDGAINPTRSTLTTDPRGYVWSNDVQYPFLTQAYDLGALGSDSLSAETFGTQSLPDNSFQRLFVGPVALSASMWSPFKDARSPLPRDARPGVYAFLLSHSNRYVEVPLTQFEDGNVVFHLPMNERLAYDRDNLSATVRAVRQFRDGGITQAEFKSLTANKHIMTFDPRSTPEIMSGQHGVLAGGAQFPYERSDAGATWASYWAGNPTLPVPDGASVAGDAIVGAVGNAIYFPSTGSVSATLSSGTLASLSNARQATVELWFKKVSGSPATPYRLFTGAGFTLRIEAGSLIATSGASSCQASLPPTSWHRVAFSRSAQGGQTRLSLFLDGELKCAALVTGDVTSAGSDPSVVVGPNHSGSPELLLLIDEVSLSSVARSASELRASALRRDVPSASAATADDFSADAGAPSPFGGQPVSPPGPTRSAAQVTALSELGRQLFISKTLSKNGDVSCATCHVPSAGFIDDRLCGTQRCITSKGTGGAFGVRNSPTLTNRLFSTDQFWDGRAQSLELQVSGPLTAPTEMGSQSLDDVVTRITPSFGAAFATAFGSAGVSPTRLAQALAAYERTLQSGASRFDRLMLTPTERAGQALFFGKARCTSCHRGNNLTDEQYHAVGFDVSLVGADLGRGAVTARSTDRGRFKTPSLRDVALTGPYYHDGRFSSLAAVVEFYSAGGSTEGGPKDLALMPLGLTNTEKSQLAAFLATLSGSSNRRNDVGERLAPTPEIIAGGISNPATGATWLVGWHYREAGATAPTVEFASDVAFTAPLSATARYDAAAQPKGYSGTWDNLTATVPVSLGSGPVYARVSSGALHSAPYRLR